MSHHLVCKLLLDANTLCPSDEMATEVMGSESPARVSMSEELVMCSTLTSSSHGQASLPSLLAAMRPPV
eukprot:scaffold945_cov403-Prasinococcus_capsulatus_cf.AAC.2